LVLYKIDHLVVCLSGEITVKTYQNGWRVVTYHANGQ